MAQWNSSPHDAHRLEMGQTPHRRRVSGRIRKKMTILQGREWERSSLKSRTQLGLFHRCGSPWPEHLAAPASDMWPLRAIIVIAQHLTVYFEVPTNKHKINLYVVLLETQNQLK